RQQSFDHHVLPYAGVLAAEYEWQSPDALRQRKHSLSLREHLASASPRSRSRHALLVRGDGNDCARVDRFHSALWAVQGENPLLAVAGRLTMVSIELKDVCIDFPIYDAD